MYRQRKFGVRTSFEFGEERFNYGIGDVSSLRNLVVDYSALDLSGRSEFSISNNIFFMRWTALLLPLAMIAFLFFEVPAIGRFLGIILIVLLVLIAAFAVSIAMELAAVTFTEIPTFAHDSNGVRGFIRIIRDTQHDAILKELQERWRSQMRKLHAHLNPTAGRASEEARLAALLRHDIITEQEYQAMVSSLHRALARETASSETTH